MRWFCGLAWLVWTASAVWANQPIWTLEERQAERDAVFRGRVESTAKIYEVDGTVPESVWVAEVEILDIRKGHRLMEGGPIQDVYYVRPGSPDVTGCPDDVELAPGDERLFFVSARRNEAGEPVLFASLGSDVRSDPRPGSGLGYDLVNRSWGWHESNNWSALELEPSGEAWKHGSEEVDRWEVSPDGILQLLSDSGQVRFRFQRGEHKRFIPIDEEDGPEVSIWLAPERQERGLHGPLPEIVEYYARQGIDLQWFSRAGGQVSGYYAKGPSTAGFRVRFNVWKFPPTSTEEQIRNRVSNYSVWGLIHGRYVLWYPSGVEVDDDEQAEFERLRARIVELFEAMDPHAP